MNVIHLMVAVAAIAHGLLTPAAATINDPEIVVYRFPGVLETGGTGTTTVFHCTNFSGATENIRFATRASNGPIVTNMVTTINSFATLTASTGQTAAYTDNLVLNTGSISQGSTAIAATSINVVCTAATIDASTTVPVGISLRGIRFNPVPGAQE